MHDLKFYMAITQDHPVRNIVTSYPRPTTALFQCLVQQVLIRTDDSSVTQYKPVTWTGRQPGSDVIVIGQKLQFCSDGILIPIEMQEYIWIPEIIRKLHVDKISVPSRYPPPPEEGFEGHVPSEYPHYSVM